MATAPLVTVLMSVHNGAPFIAESIESILGQTFRDFEFLILDDASTDDTVAIIRGFNDPRIRLVALEENIGLTASLNRGLREARGELIARQDADDVSETSRLERQVQFLEKNPRVVLIGAQAWFIDEHGNQTGQADVPLEAASVRWAGWFLNPLIHSVVTFRRDIFLKELGGYDETFTCCQDYELWMRAMEKHEAQNLPDRLLKLRRHGKSVSFTQNSKGRILDRMVVDRLLQQAGRQTDFTEAEVAVLARARVYVDGHEVPVMHRIINSLKKGMTDSPDFRRTVALVHTHFGWGMLSRFPLAGLREVFRAASICPRYGITLPWAKFTALALLGKNAQRVAAAVRGS